MIRALLVLLLMWAGAATARPVAVTSGEHDGFTRLVFDFGTPVDWQVGRTEDGYEMAIAGSTPTYDLRGIFEVIGRSRLAAIWPDPKAGNLRIGIACACHALPFEFRPGIVVIDLRDGPPPKGSSFELALDGGAAGVLPDRPTLRPRPRPATLARPYDWTRLALAGELPATPVAPVLTINTDPGLLPLRDILLQQISRGAAQGVVKMARPDPGPGRGRLPDFASAQVRIGGGPPLALDPDGSVRPDLGAAGKDCIAADRLNFAAWGSDLPVSQQWGDAMQGLSGEFDRTEPDALGRGVRFLLFLGFGAEARQMLTAFGQTGEEADLWRALGHILDDDPADTTILSGQMACEGPAALWSFLAERKVAPGALVNAAAVRLAFSALPLHLRRHLGPRVAERFLQMDDSESARAIRDAIRRAGGDAGGEVALMEADLAAGTGDPAAAEAHIRALITEPGPETADAIVALVELRAGQGLPVDPATVPALEASLAERVGTAGAADYQQALTLARAASGDPAGAFADLPLTPGAEPRLWTLLAGLGTDAQVLELAILPQGTTPSAPAQARQTLARRLLDLGFAEPAALWLDGVAEPDPVLRARADLALGDPRAVLRGLAGRMEPEALPLRLAALNALGDGVTEAATLRAVGEEEAANRALARMGQWESLAATAPSPLQMLAAGTLDAPPSPSDGPLARGHLLTESGRATRDAIFALLSETPAP